MNSIRRLLKVPKRIRENPTQYGFLVFTATLKSFFAGHVFFTYFYNYGRSWGPSMLPTFQVRDDGLWVDRSFRRGRGLKVGDVVQFQSVYEPGQIVVKRLIGLQGDYVLRDTPGSGSDQMLQVTFIFEYEYIVH